MEKVTEWREEVRGWRHKWGFTRKAAADALGISVRTLEGWENGRAPLQKEPYRRIMGKRVRGKAGAKNLNLPVDKKGPLATLGA